MLEDLFAESASPEGVWIIQAESLYELLWEAYRGKSPDVIFKEAEAGSKKANVTLSHAEDEDSFDEFNYSEV